MKWNYRINREEKEDLYKEFNQEILPYLMYKTHLRDLTKGGNQLILFKSNVIATEEKHREITKMLQSKHLFPEYMLNYSGTLEFEPGVFEDPVTGSSKNAFVIIFEEQKEIPLIQQAQLKKLERILEDNANKVLQNSYPFEITCNDITLLLKLITEQLSEIYPPIDLDNWVEVSKIQSIEDSIYYRRINCSTLNHWLCRYLYKIGIPCTKLPVITSSGCDHSILLILLEDNLWVVDPYLALLTSNPTHYYLSKLKNNENVFLYDYEVTEIINLKFLRFILNELQILLKERGIILK